MFCSVFLFNKIGVNKREKLGNTFHNEYISQVYKILNKKMRKGGLYPHPVKIF